MVSSKYFLEVCEARYLKLIPSCEATSAKSPGPEVVSEVLASLSSAFAVRLASLEFPAPSGTVCARKLAAQKHARKKSVDHLALRQFARTFHGAFFPEFLRSGNIAGDLRVSNTRNNI